ncbi:MAG: hypothetical protein MUC56_09365 [Thermoanaerobaculales bacterium]|jgi:hypothetical protein|nr:hypothetical protein [Thermoanaerobaculales bacterium]
MELVALLLLVAGGLVGLVAWVWLLVLAFRVGLGWGLAVLLLGWTWIPIVALAVLHWPRVKRPFILWGVGVVLSACGAAVAAVGTGVRLPGLADRGGGLVARPDAEIERSEPLLPPPRPTAEPTHPSWEAVVREIERDAHSSWESLVPSPTPIDGRPGRNDLSWDELAAHVGRTVVLELDNGTVITAALEGVDGDRARVLHGLGGGEASFWVDRTHVVRIRLVS